MCPGDFCFDFDINVLMVLMISVSEVPEGAVPSSSVIAMLLQTLKAMDSDFFSYFCRCKCFTHIDSVEC